MRLSFLFFPFIVLSTMQYSSKRNNPKWIGNLMFGNCVLEGKTNILKEFILQEYISIIQKYDG